MTGEREGGREGGREMTGGREGGRAQCCCRKLLRRLSDNVAVVSDGEIFHHRVDLQRLRDCLGTHDVLSDMGGEPPDGEKYMPNVKIHVFSWNVTEHLRYI